MAKKNQNTEEQNGGLPRALGSYLLLISDLLREKGYVRGVELSERLGMSRPTVTRAMQRLAELGFVDYEKYRGISLTPLGESESERVRERFQVIHNFLESTGKNFENVDSDARKLEPWCSEEVLEAFETASVKLKKSK